MAEETPGPGRTPAPAPAPGPTPEPASPAKEWAAAAVIMVVFGLLIAAFVSFLRP